MRRGECWEGDGKNQKGEMLTYRGAQEHASSVLSITTSISLNSSKTLNSPRLASVFFSFSAFRSVAFSSSPSYHSFGRSFFLSRPSCPCMLLSSSDKSHRFSQFSAAASTASREQSVEEDEKIGTEEKLDFESESGIEGFEFDGNAVMNELKCLSSPSFEVKELEELPEQWRRAKLAWLCKELPSHNAGTLNRILNAQRKWITQEDATYIAVHCMRIRENETGFRVYKWMMQQHWFRFDFSLATKLADYMGKERKFSKCREIFEDIIKQGRVPSESTFHILTIAYLSAPIQGCLEEACSVYNRMIQLGGYRPRLSLHNSLFRALVSKPGGSSKSYLKQAEFIFHNMVTSGFDVHKDVYAGLIWLHSYQETIDRERMTALRAEMWQARIEEGKDVLVSILRACSKEGDVEEAERTWLKLLQFDDGLPSQAFVYRMEVYAKVGEPMKSLEIFRVMQEHLGSASVVAYHKIIEVLSKAQEIELAETLMTEFINSALKPLMPSFIDLMTMYFKLDLHDKLESAFSQCLEKCHPNQTLYNIYLESLVKMGNLDKAEHIFNQMHNNGAIGVNARSCNNILRGYLSSGENAKAEKIYDLMCQKKYDIESPLMEKLDYVLSMNRKVIKKLRSPKLNEIQREILVGLLLGGLQIESDETRRNHMVHFEFNENSSIHCVLRSHIYDQYHEWLNSHSKPIDGTDEVPYQFSTIAHACFGYYADQFWPKGQPFIPKLIHRWLSPCVMAYWYMYGGHRTSSGDIVLKLMGSREDVERVVKALKAKSLDCRVKRKGRVFWIGFLGSNSKWFWKLTEPYILDDLKHLLKAGDQTSKDGMAENGNSSFNSELNSDEKTSQLSDNSNL